MTAAQQRVLATIGDHVLTTATIAEKAGTERHCAAHTLDALYRRSLVRLTISGHWTLTERGKRKVAA